jgi:type 1 glutamine amidotransferase
MSRTWLCFLATLALAVSAMPSVAAVTNLPRVLLLTGLGTADPSHPKHILRHEFYNDRIVDAIRDVAHVTVSDSLAVLTPENLRQFDLILNNSFLLEPNPAQLAAFFDFVEGGGGYIAMHAGLESFVNSDRYVRMMGGRLVGHSAFKEFTVDTFEDGFGTERSSPYVHPIAAGIDSFATHDELYVVQTNTDELEVIARAESHPIVWWRPWRNGSVVAFTLGHAQASVENAGYRSLLRNCVRWLTGYPLMERLETRVMPNDVGSIEDALDLDSLTHRRSGQSLQFSLANDRPDLVVATLDDQNRLDLRVARGAHGVATLRVDARSSQGLADSKTFAIRVEPRGEGNVARYLGVRAHTSSNEPRFLTADPARVMDGDLNTRWSSKYEDATWISLDLGQTYAIDRVKLVWEGAHAAQYELQVSDDGRTWRSVATRRGKGGTEETRFTASEGRFVRMLGTRRATNYGYSLHEFEVFGKPVAP